MIYIIEGIYGIRYIHWEVYTIKIYMVEIHIVEITYNWGYKW